MKNFHDILEEDVQNPEWEALAKQTRDIFNFVEKMEKEQLSYRVAFISNIMKLYMSAKTQSCALDFNCRLVNAAEYKKGLEVFNYGFASMSAKGPQSKEPENKICYANDKLADKKALLRMTLD